jgi:hypothetical protein
MDIDRVVMAYPQHGVDYVEALHRVFEATGFIARDEMDGMLPVHVAALLYRAGEIIDAYLQTGGPPPEDFELMRRAISAFSGTAQELVREPPLQVAEMVQ